MVKTQLAQRSNVSLCQHTQLKAQLSAYTLASSITHTCHQISMTLGQARCRRQEGQTREARFDGAWANFETLF